MTSDMGGGGGGGFFGIGGGFGPSEGGFNCETLSIETSLVSPDLDVLQNVNVGGSLSVSLAQEDDNTDVVQATNEQGVYVGTLMPSNLQQLIECIHGGTNYTAVVLQLSSPRCLVRVTAN